MEIGDRVVIDTKGNLKWADGKLGTVKNVEHIPGEDPDVITVVIDGMDILKPPYGLATVYEDEVIKETQTDLEQKEDENDPVNHPNHYTDGKYECINYIEFQGYQHDGYLFNAVKYISRAGKKDPDKYCEDIQKAIWYLNRKIEKNRVVPAGISTKDYIQDKGLENTLPGIALELIEKGEFSLAAKVLQMDLNTHGKHSS